MLKKLRVKFIALNMTIVAAALLISFSAVCYLNYRAELNSVYLVMHETLENAAKGENAFAGRIAPPEAADPNEPKEPPEGRGPGEFLPPEIGGQGDDRFVPVAVYHLDQTGAFAAVPTFASASLTDEALMKAADLANEAAYGKGSLNDLGLYYLKEPAEDGFFIAFADKGSASSWKTLALVLTGVGLVALAAFFVISLFFSRWALKPVKEAWSRQQRFVADASHELKTPLTVILANTAIVRAHPDESIGSQSQWIDSTQTEAERMQDLVNDMLDLAQIEDERNRRSPENLRLENLFRKEEKTPGAADGSRGDATGDGRGRECREIDLSDLVEGEALQFESVAFEGGLSIVTDIQPGVCVQGERARLERLVRTLLDNACKYSEPGGVIGVSLNLGEGDERAGDRAGTPGRGGRVKLTVRNTGSLIAAEDLPHVFDRFYRADKSRTRAANAPNNGADAGERRGGFGLGLAIAQEIAHEHGGRVKAASSEVEGTSFTVTLPSC